MEILVAHSLIYLFFLLEEENVNAHNYGQWIGVEKDLSVIESYTKYFVNITVMKK